MNNARLPEATLAQRCMAYFRRLPDEELSDKDIAIKFHCDAKSVFEALGNCVAQGYLARDGSIYSAGPELSAQSRALAYIGAGNPPPAAPASGGPFSTLKVPRAKRGPYTHARLDMAALKVDDDVPVSARYKRSGADKWKPLFDQLTQANQSIEIPLSAMGAVRAAAIKQDKANKGKFRVARTGPELARIWRLA